MGLTKEVRDFFTNRITALLDAKIENINSNVNTKNIFDVSFRRFCEDWGLDKEVISRYHEIKKQRDELEKEANDIAEEVAMVLQKATNSYSYSRWSSIDNLDRVVLKLYKDAVLADLYPDIPPQLEKIEKIKSDVQAVVMLATTETKLVTRLTAVLEKYGGEIQELLDYIPNQEF